MLAVVELLVLVFQVDKAAAEAFDVCAVVVVDIFVVSDHLFEEVRVLSEVAELTLSRL